MVVTSQVDVVVGVECVGIDVDDGVRIVDVGRPAEVECRRGGSRVAAAPWYQEDVVGESSDKPGAGGWKCGVNKYVSVGHIMS